jgi:hypothetical protein
MPSVKEKLHQLIDDCDNEILLEEAKAILESNQTSDWWNELSEDEKSLIMESEAQYEKKEFISHDELMKRFEQWKKK